MVRPDLVIGWWAAPTILEHGSQEQIEQFVPGDAARRLHLVPAVQRAGRRFGFGGACARKPFAPKVAGSSPGRRCGRRAAHKAAWGVCLARTDPDAPKHKGITYFLVDMKSPGIDIRPLREITGDNLFNEVFFDDVFVPDEMVVGAGERRLAAGAHHVGQRAGRDVARHCAGQSDGRAAAHRGRSRPRRGRPGPTRRDDRVGSGRLPAGPADRRAGGRRPGSGPAGQRAQADRRALPAGAVRTADGALRRARASSRTSRCSTSSTRAA